jgi:hypothetical protein
VARASRQIGGTNEKIRCGVNRIRQGGSSG